MSILLQRRSFVVAMFNEPSGQEESQVRLFVSVCRLVVDNKWTLK